MHSSRLHESKGKRKWSPSREVSSSLSLRGRKRERDCPRRSYKDRRTPSPSNSPSKGSSFSSSSTSNDGYSSPIHHKRRRHDTYRAWKRSRKLQRFKEGGKSITFQTYDGYYGVIDKVLTFIQQLDAAFGGEDFTESSKLRHIAMHFTKAARQWWASLKTQDMHPWTWKLCQIAIIKQFLTEDAKDKVLTAWRGLNLEKGESIQQYINKFWDLHLKAIVFKKIDFDEKRQQYCAGLTEDVQAYVNDQKPRTIVEVIHHSKVAMKIFPTSKGAPKSFERNKKVYEREQVSKESKGNGINAKKKKKTPYEGLCKLSLEEMNVTRRKNGATSVENKLAQRLGLQTKEMETALEASGAFKGQQELPPSRGEEDDHRIDLVRGSSPPNRTPYRVSYTQQEEILTQVNELLLVQKKDGSYRANDDTPMLVNYLITRLQQDMADPTLQGEVQQQLHAYGILPTLQGEKAPKKAL
ncbi:hypothetical protein L7F22_001856 [Adiantum nelumboides]|nr:hypothetical protein [Adiantum nelumboides]